MQNKYVFYLHDDLFNPENFTKEQFNSYHNKIEPIISVAKHLKAEIYYNSKIKVELKVFFSDLEKLFTNNPENELDLILKDTIQNDFSNHHFKIQFLENQSLIEFLPYQAIDKTENNFKHIFISLTNSKKEFVLTIDTNQNDFSKQEIIFFSNPEEIWNYINSCEKRIFNGIDKHGSASKKAFASNKGLNVSQLFCTHKEAQNLLDLAIFDLRKREQLFNYDTNQKKYIVFFDENSNNQFHGFHLEEKDIIKVVPNSIQDYFKHLYKI